MISVDDIRVSEHWVRSRSPPVEIQIEGTGSRGTAKVIDCFQRVQD